MSELDSGYILQVGEQGAPRLDVLNAVHGKYSQQFLEYVGLHHSMVAMEVGCGTGQMALWLAQQASTGKIIALDSSAEQVAVARQKATTAGLRNMDFHAVPIEQFSLRPESVDLIYCRYLLLHLQDPRSALAQFWRWLKPGGVVVCEEPTISTGFCYPHSEAYAHSRKLLLRLSQLRGLDFEIGLKLQGILSSLLFVDVDLQFVQPILKDQYQRQLLSMLVQECADQYINHQLSTKEELQTLILELNELVADPDFVIGFPRTTQIKAYKPL